MEGNLTVLRSDGFVEELLILVIGIIIVVIISTSNRRLLLSCPLLGALDGFLLTQAVRSCLIIIILSTVHVLLIVVAHVIHHHISWITILCVLPCGTAPLDVLVILISSIIIPLSVIII